VRPVDGGVVDESVTVVTWNAQGSRGVDLQAATSALADLGPDVVLLQEIQRAQLRSLATALGMQGRWRFKHWGVKVPAEGLGVLTRGRIVGLRLQVLAHRWAFWNWRRRVAIHVTIERAGVRTQMVDVHLGAGVTAEERVRQAEALLATAPPAVLIAGDLNAEPESRELATFATAGWRDAERRRHPDVRRPSTNWAPGGRTAPPTQRLDYLLVRDGTQVEDAFVPDDWERWAALSDHVPVVARLRFAG
jgi:endonuclease/exonuclease/phosphatase family metal-dependent hydrolase